MKRVKDIVVKSAESWAAPQWQMQRKGMIRVEQEILAFAADKETKRVLCWSCVGLTGRRRRRRQDKISDDDVVGVEDEEDDQEYIGWG